ncbi:MAG: N-acyl homoserine lactonase family protein [Actinomycetota bacterium]|nr:N-acyl homoserine lactonase family protein [Actinomycetota bacterium]MEC9058082.1 N-acyl homoserine lactonase family protein [Actinomycetota bacterium]MED5361299.1 N-acyl homoserine lactonase family protein [Actinomycetota bacterium]MEE3257211.1 N-acyl homoserine lactonase family protein [Actinomycetota bacterium]
MTSYEVHAIKYAEREAVRAEHFVGGDPHDDTSMPMDYFVWLIRNDDGKEWIVDTGFEEDDAQNRQRTLLRTASEGVALLGVDPQEVTDVIMTHFHYDHAGGVNQFPNATFHAQDQEMSFATGRDMTHKAYNHAFNVRHVQDLVGRVFAQSVTFHDGDTQLAPGLTLHLIGGHTRGLQVVRIDTGHGIVVLASDASHYWANMDEGRPFPIIDDLSKMIQGWDTLRQLAGPGGVIIPGHDPLVLEHFPASSPELEGVAARLD